MSRKAVAKRAKKSVRKVAKIAPASRFAMSEEAHAGVASLTALAQPREAPRLAPDEVERRRIADVLRIKLRSLNEAESLLKATRSKLTTPREQSAWLAAYRDLSLEQNLCLARLEELGARVTYRDPGAGEERKLMDAIKAVGDAAREGAAWVNFVTRLLALVKAYKADATR